MEHKYEIIKDESGKVINIIIDGKEASRGFVRGWNKAIKTPYFKLFDSERTYRCYNRFSGAHLDLDWFETSIFNWCMEWYKRYERNYNINPTVQTFDDMKYFLLDLNPNAYYDLID